jgi:hypothetical protein
VPSNLGIEPASNHLSNKAFDQSEIEVHRGKAERPVNIRVKQLLLDIVYLKRSALLLRKQHR